MKGEQLKNYSLLILFNLIIALCFLTTSCTTNIPKLRNQNGTILHTQVWNLPLCDTSKILIREGENYALNFPDDSLVVNTNTIKFEAPEAGKYESIFGKIDQKVINSNNKNITELYLFDEGAVYLAGYASLYETESYTRFNPQLIILPTIDSSIDTSKAVMESRDKEESSFKEGITTRSRVKLLKQGKINLGGKEEEFYEYELTISRDMKISYGEQGLIVPEAIMLKSVLVYTKDSGIIAEWGIRTKNKNPEVEPGSEKEPELYIELTRYFVNK